MITRPLFISAFFCIDHPHDKASGIPASHISNVRILSYNSCLTNGTGTIDFCGLAQRPWQRVSLIMDTQEPVATDNSINSLSSFMKREQ